MDIVRARLEELVNHVGYPIDVFICSASFEERCRSIPKHLDAEKLKCVLVAENENHRDLHGDNADYLLGRFPGKSKLVLLDTTNPLKTADSLSAALDQCSQLNPKNICVDITSFTHESFLILFNLLRTRFDARLVSYLYAGAEEYSVGDPIEKKWLSRGIGEIRSVLGYPGEILPSRKLHLIILVGFEHERVVELIRRYEPSVISLGYGDSEEPGAEKHHAANRHGFKMVKALYGDAREFHFFCYEPILTKEVIQRQAGAVPNCNVVVASMNTKLSTIGVALAALENDEIQLCYAQAIVYNFSRYSKPGEYFYHFSLA